jgi:quercetin dioxygenase-like cupin family protein
VFRIILPRGFKTPQHLHEGPGPRYVVKGRVKIEEGGQVQEYGPGQVFWESGAIMTAENLSEGEAELIVFEIVPHKATEASSIPATN